MGSEFNKHKFFCQEECQFEGNFIIVVTVAVGTVGRSVHSVEGWYLNSNPEQDYPCNSCIETTPGLPTRDAVKDHKLPPFQSPPRGFCSIINKRVSGFPFVYFYNISFRCTYKFKILSSSSSFLSGLFFVTLFMRCCLKAKTCELLRHNSCTQIHGA